MLVLLKYADFQSPATKLLMRQISNPLFVYNRAKFDSIIFIIFSLANKISSLARHDFPVIPYLSWLFVSRLFTDRVSLSTQCRIFIIWSFTCTWRSIQAWMVDIFNFSTATAETNLRKLTGSKACRTSSTNFFFGLIG